jgi:hypothetical protein
MSSQYQPAAKNPYGLQAPERSKRKHSAFQIAMGINLGLIAVGLPIAWNRVVADKQNKAKLARIEKGDPFINETEALLIQVRFPEYTNDSKVCARLCNCRCS